MSLLFNMLSRFVIAFLPRSKCLLISWLPSPSAVILEPKKIKPVTVCFISPSICREVMGPDAMILFLNVEFWANFFILLFHFQQEALYFLFAFFHKGGVICMSEVVWCDGVWYEVVGWHHQLDGHWVWASSWSWWRTGKPGVLQSLGSQRVIILSEVRRKEKDKYYMTSLIRGI